jgi:hypothetical protein
LTSSITCINEMSPCSATPLADTINSAPLGEGPYPTTLTCASAGSPAQIGPVRTSSGDGAGASSVPHRPNEALVIVPVTKNALVPTFSALLTTPNVPSECLASRSATEKMLVLHGTIWITSPGL